MGLFIPPVYVRIDGLSGVVIGDELLLAATSDQILTSAASAAPTILSVPTMGQATAISVPDPGQASSSVLLADSKSQRVVSGDWKFTGSDDVVISAGSVIAQSVISRSALFLGGPAPTPTVGIAAGALAGDRNVAIPDPGVAESKFVLTEGPVTMNGVLTLSSIPAAFDVITDSAGALAAAFPTTMNLPKTGTTAVNLMVVNSSSGDTIVYTVPTGKYALLVGCMVHNHSGGVILPSIYASPNAGVTKYLVTTIAGTVANNAAASFPVTGYVFLEGDSVVFNAAGGGLDWTGALIVFDSGKNVYAITARGLVTGPQTVFTCPAGVRASFLGTFPGFNFQGGVFRFAQVGAGTRTYTTSVTIGGLTYLTGGTAVASGTVGTAQLQCYYLSAGDTISVTADSGYASSHAWAIIWLLPDSDFPLAPMMRRAPAIAEEKKEALEDDEYERI